MAAILPLADLIDKAAFAYGLPARPVQAAKQLDMRALNYIGSVVGQRSALLSVHEIFEVTKWGIAYSRSRYPELRKLASLADQIEDRACVSHMEELGLARTE